MSIFELPITAAVTDIDDLGHVNNAVWVRWVQEVATAHWHALGPPHHVAAYLWVAFRHEIDYAWPLHLGETVTARTWVVGSPRGAKFDRRVDFIGDDGRIHVSAKTTWAMIDKLTRRARRVPADVATLFMVR